MSKLGLKNLVFASTAAVYASTSNSTKVDEESVLMTTNPYAESKLISEGDIASGKFGEFNFTILRFFNVAGADSRASVEKTSKNLIPEILRSIERDSVFKIYGKNYPTKDGTCVRDFIDVRDLIEAIYLTFDLISSHPLGVLNIGNGIGFSVLEVVRKVKLLVPQLRYDFTDPREGDHAYVVADSSLAHRLLGWKPRYSLDDMIESVKD
jgi:UDP-glucose 4-epimerase